MRYLNVIGLTLSFVIAAAQTGAAHSLDELEAQLADREKYLQPIDKDAPQFELWDADGRAVRLTDFRDKVVVLHFIYTRCPDVCPLHAERIAEIQEMVNQTPMLDQVQFISVTTDPLNDTPAVMSEYGSNHGLDPANWVFLGSETTQPENTTRKLARAYGHEFTKTDEGYQMHAVVTHVIGRAGRWRANFHGLKFRPTNLVAYINALVNDHHNDGDGGEPGFWDKLRELFL